MYHEAFWVAVAAAAPVIALAAAVAINDSISKFGEIFQSFADLWTRHDPAGTEAEIDKVNSAGVRAARFIRIAVSVGMLNIIAQAVVLAFSLTSLASEVAELPPIVAVIGEVGGVAAVASAALASTIGVLYMYETRHRAWQLAGAHAENRPATRRPWWHRRSPGI